VEIEMKAAGLLDFGTGLDNPSFAALAKSMGIESARVEDPGELPGAVERALAHPGPFLLDAVVNRQELAMPPAIQIEQAKGFTLYMLKAVMSGRGDEILDMAKTNLWR
jgi:pyruvate dehydrogenase (quinone)